MTVNNSDRGLRNIKVLREKLYQDAIRFTVLRGRVNGDLVIGLGKFSDQRLSRVGFDRYRNSPRHDSP